MMADTKQKTAVRTEKTKVASPYGHGVDVVQRMVDTLAVMARRRQLDERQLHAGLRYRHCYDVIYGQLGGASDFDRSRGGGSYGNPPPQTYMMASQTVSLVKQVLYPRDYAIVHRVCVEGLSLEECAESLYGSKQRAECEQAGRRLKEGLLTLADHWFPETKIVRVRSFRTDKSTVTDAETVEQGRAHHAGT